MPPPASSTYLIQNTTTLYLCPTRVRLSHLRRASAFTFINQYHYHHLCHCPVAINTQSTTSTNITKFFNTSSTMRSFTSRTGRSPNLSSRQHQLHPNHKFFSTTSAPRATLNQVIRGCRTKQRARIPRSPAMANRPGMKGVCLKVGITKPKKPNSGHRKVAKVRLSSGKVVTCYIPGEGRSYTSYLLFYFREEIKFRDAKRWLCMSQVIMSSSIRWCWSEVEERKIVRVCGISLLGERLILYVCSLFEWLLMILRKI